MKALFVLPEYGSSVRGGIARFYQHAIAGLRSAGCQVDVCVASSDVSRSIEGNVSVHGLQPGEVSAAQSRLSHLALFPELQYQLAYAFAAYEKCLGGEGYDVVETTDWGLLYVPWLAQRSQAPVVVQLHGSPGQIGYKDPFAGEELTAILTRALEVAYLPRADDLQTPGLANASDWQRLLGKEVRHIPPAWPAPGPNLAAAASNTFGVVAARLQSWKGPELLCKACRELGEHSPTILWLGGDHPFQKLDQSMSDYLATAYPETWGTKIIHLGSQPSDITRSAQEAAGFVVHPASWDVFGLAVVEAMGAQKVVICSDQAGASRLIEHGKNGFVYPAQDYYLLAQLLRHVSGLDKATLSRIGDRARRTVADELDMQKTTKIRLASYANLRPRRDDIDHPWLSGVFSPSHAGAISEANLLDNMPLKLLLRYVGKRLARRVLPGKIKVAKPTPSVPKEIAALLGPLTKGNVK